MYYPEIASLVRLLSKKEKLDLAQKLIQMADDGNDDTPPEVQPAICKKYNDADVPDIEARLLKLRPRKPTALSNCIKTMYKLTGGICDTDVAKVVAALKKRGKIKIGEESVTYAE